MHCYIRRMAGCVQTCDCIALVTEYSRYITKTGVARLRCETIWEHQSSHFIINQLLAIEYLPSVNNDTNVHTYIRMYAHIFANKVFTDVYICFFSCVYCVCR